MVYLFDSRKRPSIDQQTHRYIRTFLLWCFKELDILIIRSNNQFLRRFLRFFIWSLIQGLSCFSVSVQSRTQCCLQHSLQCMFRMRHIGMTKQQQATDSKLIANTNTQNQGLPDVVNDVDDIFWNNLCAPQFYHCVEDWSCCV